MPAVTPAVLTRLASITTRSSTGVAPKYLSKSNAAQCVVAFFPRYKPVAPKIRAPVQTEKTSLALAACSRTNDSVSSSSINSIPTFWVLAAFSNRFKLLGTYLKRAVAQLDLTPGGHKGHEDKSFEQELTEETEDNLTRFLASGCNSFLPLLPPFPLVQPLCLSAPRGLLCER